ncbi:MAG: hypothetical protein ACI9QL_004094 [Candidatus Omnitrophota bacterium]|jgi:hypothetical protein
MNSELRRGPTQLTFTSSVFPAYEDESEQINPDRWGMRLAEYLDREIPAHGFTPEGEPFYEDWGVCLPIKHEDFPVMLGCGQFIGPPCNKLPRQERE